MADEEFAPLTVPGLLDLLSAVAEALDIPFPGAPGTSGERDRILNERVSEARIVVSWVREDRAGAGHAAAHLRKRLAQCRAGGYRAPDEAYEARIGGKPATEPAAPDPA